MKRYSYSAFILLLMAWLPSQAFAAFDFIWTPPAGDKSIEYLGAIFGNVGNALTGSGSPIIGNLFYIFNIAVLSLGSIVVSYTVILSTMNTAQEGEVMGRKWSSVWIPLRCAVGMALLFPTASGYSLIQVMMMQFILYGVAAADQIWSVAVNSAGQSTGVTGSISMSSNQLKSTSKAVFNSMVCAQTLNNDPACQAAIGNRQVTTYVSNDQVYVGVPGDPNYANVCGSIQAANAPKGVDEASWQAANLAGIQSAASNLYGAAGEVVSGNASSQNVLASASDTMRSTITSAAATSAPPDSSNDKANNGWLFAGSYYFEMQKGGTQSTKYRAPNATGPDVPSSLGSACLTQISTYSGQGQDYLSQSETRSSSSKSSDTLQIQPANVSQSEILTFYNELVSPIEDLTYGILDWLTTRQDDPISSLRQVGADIMSTCENLWFAIMVVAFIAMIAGCVSSGMLSPCWAIGAIVSLLIPILTTILILLWSAGVAIGLYLPLVPYLVFTFTALGWFILVIEAMAAAPVVAIGLVSPAAETLGKAAPAVMIITNVFLRPSLMVIGFVIAMKLVQAAIMMVNFGFEATVKGSTGSLGIFGCIALICLYGGLVITIVHECFSLIYVLPDKIIRWIGGSPEQSNVKGSVQEVKQASEKGAEVGSSLMKGSMSAVEGKISKGGGQGGGGGGAGGIGGLAQ